jgi:Caspase domain
VERHTLTSVEIQLDRFIALIIFLCGKRIIMTELFTHGYAVIIGVGADLPVTVQDASALADLLCDRTRCGYPVEHVRLLTGERARRSHILEALDGLVSQTAQDPDATAVVYFSGHGMEKPDAYLMPFGYDLADLSATAIEGRLFTEKLRAISARKLLVLLDCCHAGGQADAKDPTRRQTPMPPAIVDMLRQSSGRVIIASSRKDEASYTGNPYSVFTAALLESLAGYGAFERDGYARVLDLALYVGRFVPSRTGDKQHPIIKVSNLEDNFALAYYAAGEHHPKRLEWAPPLLAASNIDTAQAATWRRMLANRREALLLIEERISEYVEYQETPIQLIKNQRKTEAQIAQLEQNLGL